MNLIAAFKDDRYLIPLDLAERMGFTRNRSGVLKFARALRTQHGIRTKMARINGGAPVRCYDVVDFKCAARGHAKPPSTGTLAKAQMAAKRYQLKVERLQGQLKHYQHLSELVSELRVLLPKLGSVSVL